VHLDQQAPRKPLKSPSGRLRVALHIGPQKTGTSYMQLRMFHLRNRLAIWGIVYHVPESLPGLPPGTPIHASNIGTLLLKGDLGAFTAQVAAIRAQGAACLVLSSELLSKLPPERIAPLREIFAGDEMEIYAYCRRWSERLPSHWGHQVSSGGTTPFPKWHADLMRRGARSWMVNESRLWQRWADLFGRDAINILSYDVLRDRQIDIADDFTQNRLGWPGQVHREALRKQVRVMPPPLEIEVIRSLHVYAGAQGIPLTMARQGDVLDALRAADFQPFRAIVEGKHKTITIDDTDPCFAPALQDMQAWEDRLVTRDLSPAFMLPRQAQFPFVPPHILGGAAANTAFGELLATV
jgi:hypothetical protein